MSFQPEFLTNLCAIESIKIHFSHTDQFIELNDPQIDNSHIHNFFEIYVNVSGDVAFLHNHNVYQIHSGDIILSKPGEIHHCIYHSACVHEHYCIWFELPESSAIASYIDHHQLNGLVRLNSNLHEQLFTLLRQFSTSINCNNEFELLICFFDLLKLFSQKCLSSQDANLDIPVKMQTILNYINESFAEIDSIDQIAIKFHLSVPTINRWFRQYLKLSPRKLLTAKKLAYAEQLLHGDHSVLETCYLAGFSDCSRFISLFRNNYGKTPFQYKKGVADSNRDRN